MVILLQEPVEDLDPERILDLQTDSRLHVISGGTKVVQHSPPLKASAGLKRKLFTHGTSSGCETRDSEARLRLSEPSSLLQLWTMAAWPMC